MSTRSFSTSTTAYNRRSRIAKRMTAARFGRYTDPEMSGVVRRPQVGERGEQIAVGSYLILRHLPISEDS
jgi:hypothetical protein